MGSIKDMSDFKGGYRTEVARYELIPYERTEYEEYLKTHELIDLEGRMVRGEPNPIDPAYGGVGYEYFKPEIIDLGRVKVSKPGREWKFEWEDVNIG
mgnify:CR=1 FL=1